MVLNKSNMTAEELGALASSEMRYELVRGTLRMMSPAGGRHGRISLRVARRVGDYVEEHELGETYAAETGFLLARNPDTVRAPDLAFISSGRLGDQANFPGYLPIVPDLVVEVLSPHDRPAEVEEKTEAWLAAGVAIVLIIDPQAKTMQDFRPDATSRLYREGLIELDPVIPGLRLDLDDLFA
jgi:Uma2 family endonuclease